MSGRELRDYLNESYDRTYQYFGSGELETMEQMWDRKVEESKVPEDITRHGSGVMDFLKKDGYNWDYPMNISAFGDKRLIWNGHHRVASAADIEEETGKQIYIPVKYSF